MFPNLIPTMRKTLATFEGVTDFMYLDQKGLVTTGVGNLIDPKEKVNDFEWLRKDDTTPTPEEVDAEWDQIQKRQADKNKGGMYFKQFATLHITPSNLEKVFTKKATDFVGWLQRNENFKEIDDFPWDAQLGIMMWIWATGSGKPEWYQEFKAACKKQDWEEAAKNVPWPDIDEKRERALKQMFTSAANVQGAKRLGLGSGSSGLYYPDFAPSVPRLVFEDAVKNRKWDTAYTNLNGLSMREMLLSLNNLTREKREEFWAVRDPYGKACDLPRIEYALAVVNDRKLPKEAPGDLESTGQVKQAKDFLKSLKK